MYKIHSVQSRFLKSFFLLSKFKIFGGVVDLFLGPLWRGSQLYPTETCGSQVSPQLV